MAVATFYQGMIYKPFGLGCLFSDISILEVPVAIGAVPGALQSGALEPEVGVVSNGDAGVVLGHNDLSLVQSGIVRFGIGDLGSIDGSVEGGVVVFAVCSPRPKEIC